MKKCEILRPETLAAVVGRSKYLQFENEVDGYDSQTETNYPRAPGNNDNTITSNSNCKEVARIIGSACMLAFIILGGCLILRACIMTSGCKKHDELALQQLQNERQPQNEFKSTLPDELEDLEESVSEYPRDVDLNGLMRMLIAEKSSSDEGKLKCALLVNRATEELDDNDGLLKERLVIICTQ